MLKRYRLHFIFLILLFPAGLLLQWLCANSPQATETIYSRGFYLVISGLISPIFGVFPFSVAELLILAFAVLLIWFMIRTLLRLKQLRLFGAARFILKLAAAAAVGFFLFEALWGLNYYRRPLSENLNYKKAAVDTASLTAMTESEISAVNKLSEDITYDKSGSSVYSGGFSAMKKQVNAGFKQLQNDSYAGKLIKGAAASPKGVIPSSLMSYAGIEGIFIPFTYEPSINTDCPDLVLPFNISHESAHLKGFAREDEANFIAYLACSYSPDLYYQYSGHLTALMYLSNALYSTDQTLWQQEFSKLDRRAAVDIDNYYDFVKKHQGKASDTANKINDSYLKSQGQTEGVISYDMFVNLLAGMYASK